MAEDRIRTSAGAKRLGAYLFCSPALVRSALQKQGQSLRNPRRNRRIGEILVEAESISTDELDAAIHSQRVARLAACPLFASLGRADLSALAHRFEEVSVAAGEQFIRQGDTDPTLYVVATGRLEAFHVGDDGREVPLAVIEAGEPIGEMGYFAGGVRAASVRALESSELLRASYADLTHYFENVPHVAPAFVDVVMRRRADNDRRLRRVRQCAEAAALPHLRNFIEPAGSDRLSAGMLSSIERLIRAAASVTLADRASLFLIDRDSGELWTMVAVGLQNEEIRLPRGVGIAGWVAEHNELVNVADAYADPRFNPDIDKRTGYRTHTLLSAPVRNDAGRPVGVVQVINKQFGAFTEEDERLLRAFCDQVAHAVDNFETYRRLLRDQELYVVLLEVATLVTRVPDLAWLASRLGERVEELLDCERCDLLFPDYDANELWSMRRETGQTVTNRYNLASIPAGAAAIDGATVNVLDASHEAGFDPAINARLRTTVRNLLAVPVRNSGREIVAVLQVVNKRRGSFNAGDERLLEAIAAQLGVAAAMNH
jgi:GAF domain-containing protein